MGFNATEMLEIIETMEGYLSRNRPPEHIRRKLDIGYRIEKQNVFVFEIRPQWDQPKIYHQYDFAKATLIKRQLIWKIFWMRASLNWDNYPTKNPIKLLSDFVSVIEEDEHGCFNG